MISTLQPTTLTPVDTKDTIDTIDMSKNTAKNTVDGRAEAMFQSLFAGQLEAMARQMASQFNIDPEEAAKMATAHAASIDLKQVAKPKHKSTGKARKPKVPVTAENRCMARVWGNGSGANQCKCARVDGADYCSRHGKQAAISEIPCQLDDNGNKLGLFCGRIDQFQEGTTLAPFMIDGEIRIEWNSLEHKEAIVAGMENDTIRHRKKKMNKKKKATATVVEVNEEELASMVAGNEELVNDVDNTSIIHQVNDDLQMVANVDTKISEEEAARRASIIGHQARIEVLQKQSDLVNIEEEEEEEDSLDVEEWEHQGESYLVCRETLTIYNEEGEEIGKWGEGATEGTAIPAE